MINNKRFNEISVSKGKGDVIPFPTNVAMVTDVVKGGVWTVTEICMGSFARIENVVTSDVAFIRPSGEGFRSTWGDVYSVFIGR